MLKKLNCKKVAHLLMRNLYSSVKILKKPTIKFRMVAVLPELELSNKKMTNNKKAIVMMKHRSWIGKLSYFNN